MNHLSCLRDGAPTWGVENDGFFHDLGPSGAGEAATLADAIATGVFPVSAIPEGAPKVPIADVTFLPAIPDPRKIICVGMNYRSHQEETGREAPVAPTLFIRFADSQMGHLAPAIRPATTTQFDYEGEVALVIGKSARSVGADDAWDLVAGYAIYNDFSVRDWQRETTQWTPGKNFPNTGAFGPYLVPAVDISDVTALELETRVNGEVRQRASVADLVFDIPRILAYVTGFTPLSPGDVIVTGTPAGVGLFMQPSGMLSKGDVVEVEVTSLGVLRNEVVQG